MVHGHIIPLVIPAGEEGRYGFTVDWGNAVTCAGAAAKHGLREWDKIVSYNGLHLGDRRLAEVIASSFSPSLPSSLSSSRSPSLASPLSSSHSFSLSSSLAAPAKMAREVKRAVSFGKEKRQAGAGLPERRAFSFSPRSRTEGPEHPRVVCCRVLVLRLVRTADDITPDFSPASTPRHMLSRGLSFRRAFAPASSPRGPISPRASPATAGMRGRRISGKRASRLRIREQWLLKRIGGNHEAKWQPRKVCLTGTAIVYGQVGKDARDVIEMKGVLSVEVRRPDALVFSVRTRSETHTFRAANQAQFIYWVSELMLLTGTYRTGALADGLELDEESSGRPSGDQRAFAVSRASASDRSSRYSTAGRLSKADLGVLEAYAASALQMAMPLLESDFTDYDDGASEFSEFDFEDYDGLDDEVPFEEDIQKGAAEDSAVRRQLRFLSLIHI